MESQKVELNRKEQEVLDTVTTLTHSLQHTKKNWEENITELAILLQEQKQTMKFFSKNKDQRIVALEEEIDKLFGNTEHSISRPPLSSARGNLSTDRNRLPMPNMMNKLPEFLSPIEHCKNVCDKSKEEPLTKRSNLPDNSVEDLAILDQMTPNQMDNMEPAVDGSRLSIPKNHGEWDPALDDTDDGENIEVDRIEKALELLNYYGLLDSDHLEAYRQLILNTSDRSIERDVQMNVSIR